MWKHAACIQYLQKDKAFARYGPTGKTSCRRSEKTKLNDNSKMPLLVRGWLLVQVLTILHSNQRNTVHGGISKSFLFVLMSRFLWAIPIQSAFTLKKVSVRTKLFLNTDAQDLLTMRFGFLMQSETCSKLSEHRIYCDIVQLRTNQKNLDRSKHFNLLIPFT